MAKMRTASESWIAMMIIVMNIARVLRDIFLPHFYWLSEAMFEQLLRANRIKNHARTVIPFMMSY